MIKIAALQLSTLALSNQRLDHYLAMCKRYDAKLVVLGEYVLNSFFTELVKMPKSMIKEQSEVKKQSLKDLAKKYDLEIIAPFISVEKNALKKLCIKVNKSSLKSYEQQILINYPHWNEEKFFSNKLEKFKLFYFTHEGFKIAVFFGFEAHFNLFWDEVRTKKIDLVLLPCANTFSSTKRWESLLTSRAFCQNVNVLRVNRIGSVQKDWDFYGESMMIDANGCIQDKLLNEEGLLISEVLKPTKEKKFWGFDKSAKRLEALYREGK